jgi:hypothetical protein
MKVYNAKVEETYRHLKTGEVFKEKKDWVDKGYKPQTCNNLDKCTMRVE